MVDTRGELVVIQDVDKSALNSCLMWLFGVFASANLARPTKKKKHLARLRGTLMLRNAVYNAPKIVRLSLHQWQLTLDLQNKNRTNNTLFFNAKEIYLWNTRGEQ